MEDLVEEVVPTSETTEEQVETPEVDETTPEVPTEQDPLKIELEKVQNRSKYTEEEKAEFTFKKQAERLKSLGKDPADILGIKTEDEIESEDNRPLTIGEYKKMMAGSVAKTALQEADSIQNETERELVKYNLENTIKSTGIPSEDLKLARALVNAVKNNQMIEEISRKAPAKTHSNSSGVDANKDREIVYTADELNMMKPPFNVTPAQILAAREGKKFDFKNAAGK